MPKAKTQEQFDSELRAIYKDSVEYINTTYVNARSYIELKCKTCSHLWGNTANNFLNHKTGCPKCSNNYQKTNEEWINLFKTVHGDKYDYSKFNYINSSESCIFICKKHNIEFPQPARVHAKGHGCKLCANENRNKKRKTPLDKWIEDCKKVHGDKYDYSKSVYKGSNEIIEVICPTHGSFFPTAYNHKKGSNCNSCVDRNKERRLKASNLFESKANKVHNSKFDYSLVHYVNMITEVDIICPNGHIFKQTPAGHLSGRGCRYCRQYLTASKKEMELSDFISSFNLEIISNHRPSWFVLEDCKLPSEIDIYIPELNLGIEYNGIAYHHSSLNKTKYFDNTYVSENFHLEKYNKCLEHGINLIHIFEFEDLEEWKEKLKMYFNDPSLYSISFKNNKRYYQYSKNIMLEYYGESFVRLYEERS